MSISLSPYGGPRCRVQGHDGTLSPGAQHENDLTAIFVESRRSRFMTGARDLRLCASSAPGDSARPRPPSARPCATARRARCAGPDHPPTPEKPPRRRAGGRPTAKTLGRRPVCASGTRANRSSTAARGVTTPIFVTPRAMGLWRSPQMLTHRAPARVPQPGIRRPIRAPGESHTRSLDAGRVAAAVRHARHAGAVVDGTLPRGRAASARGSGAGRRAVDR